MANYTYNRKTVDKLNIKGILSNDLSKITYTDKDGDTFDVTISSCLGHFAGQNVTLSITLATDTDLLEEEEPEEDPEES